MRRADAALGAALAIWAAAVTLRAAGEVLHRPEVQGLRRVFRPPIEDGPLGGPVLDPRPTALDDELRARYGLERPAGPPDARGPGRGTAPRLVTLAGAETPALVVGPFGEDLVVFVEGVGVAVARAGALPDDAPAWQLAAAPERAF